MDISQRFGNYNTLTAYEAYFKAPVTGQYRFLMSCDDHCSFKINTDTENPMDPSGATQILWRPSWTYYRNTDIGDKSLAEGDGKNYSAFM
jgi:hypothetical protein